MPNSLDVQIVSHGTPDLVEQLLDDLEGEPCTIHVLENLPGARPIDRPGIRWGQHADGHPRGFGENHNLLARQGRAELVAILNPDLRVRKGVLAELSAAFRDASVGVVAPRVHAPDGALADNARRILTPGRLLRDRLWPSRRQTDYPDAGVACAPDWVAGMFMVVRRSVFEELRGFDTDYRMYCEDMDLCLRSWQAGHQVRCVPCEGVVHDARRASLRDPTHLGWHLASLWRFWHSAGYRRIRAGAPVHSAFPAAGGRRG